MFINISEVLAASIIRAMEMEGTDDGGSSYL
jgi:hypothetical protein